MSTITYNYNNKEEIPQGNSRQIFCAVYDSSDNLMNLTGYAATFYAAKDKILSDGTVLINRPSTSIDASNGAIIFDLTTTDTSLASGNYLYEIIIDNSANRYSVIQDRLSITDSLKNI